LRRIGILKNTRFLPDRRSAGQHSAGQQNAFNQPSGRIQLGMPTLDEIVACAD
jgi:hypothetical protein